MSGMESVLGTPQDQLGLLLDDESVAGTYAMILAMRCPKCGSAAGIRCRTTTTGQITYPHAARTRDAVSAVAYIQRRIAQETL